MKSFPVRRKPTKESEAASKPWFSFHIPFVGSFHSKQTIVAVAVTQEQQQAGASGAHAMSPERDSVASQITPNAKEVSTVSKFEDFERHSSVHSMHSVHSVHSVHSIPSARSNATPKGGEHGRERENSALSVPRRLSGSEDAEAPSLRRFASSSARHSLSQSSKGPSWIEKVTPTTSFQLDGAMTGAILPNMLPTFTWSHKKPPRRYEQLDIEAVITKLEHSGRPHEIALWMNHDDHGLLGDPVPPRASLVMTVEEGAEGTEAESRKQEVTPGGAMAGCGVADMDRAGQFCEGSRLQSELDVLEHIEEDIEMGRVL